MAPAELRELAMPARSKSALWLGILIGTALVASTSFLVARAGHAIGSINSASSSHSTRTPAPGQSGSVGPSPIPTPTGPPVSHGRITWNDDFSTKGLSGWRFLTGNVGGQAPMHELQYYEQSNATVSHGTLVLTANKGGGGNTCKYGPCQYTSVRMISYFQQAYGVFEARIKLAGGLGIWPAFWMQGANFNKVGLPAAGEIDIAEINGQPPTNLLGGYIHAPNNVKPFYQLMPHALSDGYHIYAIAWTTKGITFYVDGKPYGNFAAYSGWPYNHPFNIILSLAVGGKWPRNPPASTHFPVHMYVSWLRVYRPGR